MVNLYFKRVALKFFGRFPSLFREHAGTEMLKVHKIDAKTTQYKS